MWCVQLTRPSSISLSDSLMVNAICDAESLVLVRPPSAESKQQHGLHDTTKPARRGRYVLVIPARVILLLRRGGVREALAISQRTVIIAVIAVLVVQASVNQIIGMVAVRDRLMAATLVAANAGDRCTIGRIGGAHGNHTLVVVFAVDRMQVAIVQIIHVAFMLNAEVAAMLTVRVSMPSVCSMLLCSLRHCPLSFLLTLE